MGLLTQEDILFIARRAKNNQSISMDYEIHTWVENGVKMGEYSAYIDTHFPILYRDTYENCLIWKEEAFKFWDEVYKKFRQKELKDFQDLGIDI